MKKLLLFDPLVIGHHLIYSTNVINWALSRGYRVLFAGHGFRDSFLYRKFINNNAVEFIEIDFHTDLAINTGNRDVTYADLYFTDCTFAQVKYVRYLQSEHQPDATLFLYGDHMDFAWRGMLDTGERFEKPTYMIYLFSATPFYHARETQSSLLFRRIREYGLFDGIFMLDEYQKYYEKDNSNLYFLPDPYKDHSFEPSRIDQYLSESESTLIKDLDRFFAQNERKILLIIGWFSQRKNIHWLLELAYQHEQLSFVMIGKRVQSAIDGVIDETLSYLKERDRLFYHSGFVSPYVFDHILRSERIEFLALPYSCHFGSSALHLLGLDSGLPTLVPDIGLMGTRSTVHHLGFTFRHDNKSDFQAKFSKLMTCDRAEFKTDIESFMGHFDEATLFSALDNGFQLATTGKSPLETQAYNLLSTDDHSLSQASQYIILLKKALLQSKLGHHKESLEQIDLAILQSPENPGLLFRKHFILQNMGKRKASFECLESIRMIDPGYVELQAYERNLYDCILYKYEMLATGIDAHEDANYKRNYFKFIDFYNDYLSYSNIHYAMLFLAKSSDAHFRNAKEKMRLYFQKRLFRPAFVLFYFLVFRNLYHKRLRMKRQWNNPE